MRKIWIGMACCIPVLGVTQKATTDYAALVTGVNPKVVEWRRYLHQHPELGNREFKTAEMVAKHLRSLGIEVREKVGVTGVVGVLKGGKPGPVVALRADMDALPVKERVNLPFKSEVTAERIYFL